MAAANIPQEEYSILLCGSPRVGKSTLINALCGQKLADTSASLHACTMEQARYTLTGEYEDLRFVVNFWDSPGIESWEKNEMQAHIAQLIQDTNPICMIYCVSPGSFARLDQIDWIVQTCWENNIFCALVCTNMWANSKRYVVKKELMDIFSQYESSSSDNAGLNDVVRFGKSGLVALVNSTRYVDKELGIDKCEQGVNELIIAVAEGLEDEKLLGWLYTIANNESVWTSMREKLNSICSRMYNSVWEYISYPKTSLNKLGRTGRPQQSIYHYPDNKTRNVLYSDGSDHNQQQHHWNHNKNSSNKPSFFSCLRASKKSL